jgi:hypothetical protein
VAAAQEEVKFLMKECQEELVWTNLNEKFLSRRKERNINITMERNQRFAKQVKESMIHLGDQVRAAFTFLSTCKEDRKNSPCSEARTAEPEGKGHASNAKKTRTEARFKKGKVKVNSAEYIGAAIWKGGEGRREGWIGGCKGGLPDLDIRRRCFPLQVLEGDPENKGTVQCKAHKVSMRLMRSQIFSRFVKY